MPAEQIAVFRPDGPQGAKIAVIFPSQKVAQTFQETLAALSKTTALTGSDAIRLAAQRAGITLTDGSSI